MMERLAARLRGMVSRAVVGLVNDATKLQSVQVTVLADQVADDAEHFQHYGYTSVPHPGAEGVALAVGGSTGHTVVVNVDDRRYRIKGLASGEVALYDDLGHVVHLTRTGIVIRGAGHPVTITGTPLLRVEADIEATGQITDLCNSGAARSMAQMRDSHTAHTHNENNNLGGSTSQPTQPI
ncbi:MAG: phage baseplate assembly protein V [Polaromonas sp.]